MLIPVLRFELKYHFTQTVFRIASLIFFLLGVISTQGSFGTDVHPNSPYAIANITGLLSLCAIFSGTLFCANAVLRDKTYRLEAILFSTSVSKLPYFVVRFTGLLLTVFITQAFASLGMLAGSMILPSTEAGPVELTNYLYPLMTIAFPNILLCCTLLFSATVLSGSIRAVYAAGVLLYILYWIGSIAGNSPLLATSDPTTVPHGSALLADPFGLSVFFSETKRWTAAQKNTDPFPLERLFLVNRLVWYAVSFMILLLSFRLFRFHLKLPASTGRTNVRKDKVPAILRYRTTVTSLPGSSYSWNAFLSQLKLESAALFKHIPFMVMMLIWIFLYAVELKDTLFGGLYSIRSFPDTSIILEEFVVARPAMILIIFYAAELIWRERSSDIHSLVYSGPVKNIVPWAAKMGCLAILIMAIITANIGIGIAIQLISGYGSIQWLQYVQLYYYCGWPLLLFAALAVFVITLMPNKYIGMLIAATLAAVIIFSRRLGLEHYLLRYASMPDMLNSSMNGFGHYALSFKWYMLYWSGLAIVLSSISIIFWRNHREESVRRRVLTAVRQSGRLLRLIPFAGLAICIGAGSWIYYQTNTIGGYKGKLTRMQWQVDYEKKYRSHLTEEQPVIRSVRTEVALYPREQRYTVNGVYLVKNESAKAMNSLWLGVDPSVTNTKFKIPGKNKLTFDRSFGQYQYKLDQALAPGDQMEISFSLEVNRSGFTTFNNENAVVSNGSYVELEKILPWFGYSDRFETDNKTFRLANGLPEEPAGGQVDSLYHFVNYETTISTDEDQTIVTVGDLLESSVKDGRAVFHYRSSVPVPFMFAFSSARYEVKEEDHNGIKLRLFYQQGHEANIAAMLAGMKDALDYGAENFSPYQYKQLSLAEIPQYRGAATAYPGVIFQAERISFLSDYSDTNRINQSYAIAAHETAHQWWAVALEPAPVAGRKVLTESLAKYTENVVIRKHFGKMYLRNYFRDDNRFYSVYRSMTDDEKAMDSAIGQPFVYYQKGGLVMYAIQETLGEQQFNAVLQQMIYRHGNGKVKATVTDLQNALIRVSSPGQASFINDQFSKIINWQLSCNNATVKALANGTFEVTVEINAKKLEGAFHAAKETAINDSIEIAVFKDLPVHWSRKTKPVYIAKHLINAAKTKLRVIVDTKPVTIAADPYGYLPDDNPDDNTVSISFP